MLFNICFPELKYGYFHLGTSSYWIAKFDYKQIDMFDD